jgi:TusA-related sulfurtransferase
MRIVDTKGQFCPAPLIATKKALKETAVGESFMVQTDNLTSFNNLSRFLKDNRTEFIFEELKGVWTITITKKQSELVNPNAEEYCTSSIS